MKGVLSSTTVIGALVALFAKVSGLEVSNAEAADVLGQVKSLWPILVGIAADISAAWWRVKATRFDVEWYRSKTFWAGVVSAVMTLAASLGVDVSALQPVIDKSIANWPAVVALAGSLLTIVGRWKAKKRITSNATYLLLLAAVLCVALPGCSTVPTSEPVDACPVADRDVRRSSCAAVRGKPLMAGLFAWAEGKRLWNEVNESGQVVVTVAFLDGSEKQKAKAWQRFATIDSLAPGLEFVRVASGGDIRVSFACSGHWSYVGTWARRIPQGKATMNLELSSGDSDTEWDRVGHHEVLHAIGFGHEHQSPLASIPWNEAKVVAFYQRTQGWSEQQVREQVLDPAYVEELLTSGFDPQSIMMYPVPAELTDGKLVVGWNTTITERDKQLIAEAYPAPRP